MSPWGCLGKPWGSLARPFGRPGDGLWGFPGYFGSLWGAFGEPFGVLGKIWACLGAQFVRTYVERGILDAPRTPWVSTTIAKTFEKHRKTIRKLRFFNIFEKLRIPWKNCLGELPASPWGRLGNALGTPWEALWTPWEASGTPWGDLGYALEDLLGEPWVFLRRNSLEDLPESTLTRMLLR